MPYQFLADARDGTSVDTSPCGTSACCCRQANAAPGEINGWSINYQPWVAQLGGRGLANPTQIVVTKLATTQQDVIVTVPPERVVRRGTVVSFSVVVMSQATVGDVYRIAVRQAAMDCAGNLYWHISCYDVEIVTC